VPVSELAPLTYALRATTLQLDPPGPSLTGGRSDDAQLDVHFFGGYVGHLDNETQSRLLEVLDAVSLSGTDILHVDHPVIALADRGRGVVGHPSSQLRPRQEVAAVTRPSAVSPIVSNSSTLHCQGGWERAASVRQHPFPQVSNGAPLRPAADGPERRPLATVVAPSRGILMSLGARGSAPTSLHRCPTAS
jgi:hypothetical protein